MDRTRRIFIGILGLALAAVILVIIIGGGGGNGDGSTPSPTQPPVTPPDVVKDEPLAETGRIELLFLTADTKAEWIEKVTETFNNAGYKTAAGNTVFVEVMEEGSPDVAMQAVVSRELQPVAWSPGDISWVETANQESRDLDRGDLVTEECPPIVYAATGFAMWRPMAEVLGWPDTPIGWDDIVDLAADPEGWGTHGRPEWGTFKFGHTHPAHSNTGFSMLATLAYAALDKTSDLTPELVKSEAVIEDFRKVELNTYHYGTSTRELMDLMADRGPSYLHAVTASETAVLKNNKVRPEKIFPYVFIFPSEGTFWSDNPFCILETDWVSAEQREAAGLYRNFLLEREQQEVAVTIGLRPADPSVPLAAPISLEYGTDPRVSPKTVPPLGGLTGETAQAVIDVFHLTKKKATIIIVLDTSLSMEGEKIKGAVDGTIDFISRLDPDDEVIVFVFNDEVQRLEPSGRRGDVGEQLRKTLGGLFADGNTALYDAVCQSVELVDQLKEEDEAAGDRRLYGIILLSDGDDTHSSRSEFDMFACLPSGEDVQGTKVFTIAYGENADLELLTKIANRTNGEPFEAGPSDINEIYLAISSQQ